MRRLEFAQSIMMHSPNSSEKDVKNQLSDRVTFNKLVPNWILSSLSNSEQANDLL